MRWRNALAIVLACGVGLVAGGFLLGGGVSGAATVPATIKGYAFNPSAITVATGDTVTWTNGDTAPHTVTSIGGGPLNSPNLQQGDSWSFTFTKPGTYPFYCAVHPDMKGTVTVTGAAAPATTAPAPTTTTMAMGHGSSTPPTTPTTMAMTTPTTTATTAAPGLVEGIIDPFWVHLQKGHLESSPAQQVSDILNLDQYVKTHTVLVETMLSPLMGLANNTSDVLSPFWVHLQKGHLESSPAQQVSDILSIDQYVKTHTVLVENMLAPLLGVVVGSG